MKSVLSLPRNAPRADLQAAAAVCVALAGWALYRATLLPGFDFGDTGSLQTTVGSTLITPRVGYPLYFAVANLWLDVVGGDPARALNLASAVAAALACGLSVLVAIELSGSIAAAIAAVLLFAVSYTYWSQSIIAEVYALHILLVALTLFLLLRWANRPTTTRLTLFFLAFAVGFGNHLSMVLLAPAYTLFLLLAAKDGWRSMLAPRVVLLATACAAVGAAQYIWNLRALWFQPQPPSGLFEALSTFWFDVTKSDWRDTMVLHVPRSMIGDHAAMYWFDLRQQFGPIVPLLAVAGLVQLATRDARRAALMAVLFATNVAFAFSYNVGDAHVFYLPSHFFVALLVAPGLVLAARLTPRAVPLAAALTIAYAGARAYRDFPALDRSGDTRPAEVIGHLTAELDDQRNILLTDMNWQVANGLSYFAKVRQPAIAHARAPDLLLYAPALVKDNHAVGRSIALSERARSAIDAAYGPLLPTMPDPRVVVSPLAERVAGLPAGTPYVLCLLKPSRDMTLDADDLAAALRVLLGTSAPVSNLRPAQEPPFPPATAVPSGDYAVVAGVVGRPPDLAFGANFPFTKEVQLDGLGVQVRMESWLSADTIRRMGFGHVVAGRHHSLIVERGVSFAALDPTGRAIRTAYAANIFSPRPRYLIRTDGPATP
jgi:4-amino-4-deoxy-L-arabinose transferase-like glycosyltransferase